MMISKSQVAIRSVCTSLLVGLLVIAGAQLSTAQQRVTRTVKVYVTVPEYVELSEGSTAQQNLAFTAEDIQAATPTEEGLAVEKDQALSFQYNANRPIALYAAGQKPLTVEGDDNKAIPLERLEWRVHPDGEWHSFAQIDQQIATFQPGVDTVILDIRLNVKNDDPAGNFGTALTFTIGPPVEDI